MSRRLLAALALPLALSPALTACSDDDPSGGADGDTASSSSDGPATAGGESPDDSAGAAGDLTAQDEAAIDANLKEFLVSGDCDLTTEDYLPEIAILAPEGASRDELCASWEETFSEPLYTEDDILLSDLQGSDGVVTVEVGSEVAPDVTILYELTLTDGEWLVSGDEISSIDLGAP